MEHSNASQQRTGLLPLLGTSFLAFLIICLCVNATVKGTTVITVLVTTFAVLRSRKKLGNRIYLPILALFGVVAMDGISSLYAAAGKMAVYEFPKILTAFCLALLALCFASGEGKKPGQQIGSFIAATTAISGVVSIDLISTHTISGFILSLLRLFTNTYESFRFFESGIRINSLFENPNVFAGIMGIGTLLSLGLVTGSETKSERQTNLVFLFINSLSFVLAFSMGASASILPAFLLCLLLEHKERRTGLFLLMLETLLLTMGAATVISATSFQNGNAFQPIPMLCVVAGSILLCVTDRFFVGKQESRIPRKLEITLPLSILLVGALFLFCLAAYNTTGGITMEAKDSLRRSIYPAPGEYTLSVSGDEGARVTITSQNRQDTMMHTSTRLYKGSLDGATFTVPEDSLVVYLEISARKDLTLDSVEYFGPESGQVPLDYKLLPSFIANRLQGLWANENAIQRFVFFSDGLKLFARSPLIGHGVGAFENSLRSVQSFQYDTKYVHNHYIQVMLETGVIGLILFLLLLGSSAAVILRARRREDFHPLLPALGGALVFMAIHALTEVVFSTYSYIPFAFCVFALINLCCGDALPLPIKRAKTAAKVTGLICTCFAAFGAVFAVLLTGNMYASSLLASNASFENLDKAIKTDKYEWETYAIAYVGASIDVTNNAAIYQNAAKYAQMLYERHSTNAPIYLADYYFNLYEDDKAFEMLEEYVTGRASEEAAWQEAFDLLEKYMIEDVKQIKHLLTLMETWNTENMGTLKLSENNIFFLEIIGAMD